jgi:hypothetical protein
MLVAALLLWRRRKGEHEGTKYMLTDDFKNTHSLGNGNRLHRGTTGDVSISDSWRPPPARPAELQDTAALVEMEAQTGNANHRAQKTGEAAELPGSSPEIDGVVVMPYGVLESRK